MKTLHQHGYKVFVEIGPKPTLLGMGRQCLREGVGVWLPSLRPGQGDWQQILQSLGELYIHGVSVDWWGFHRDYPKQKIVLPTYPFQRERYWLSPKAISEPAASIGNQTSFKPNKTDTEDTVAAKIQSIISEIGQIPKEKLNLDNTLRELGFDFLMLMEMKSRLMATFPIYKDLPLKVLFGSATVG